MPRVKPVETPKARSSAQLANDERLRSRRLSPVSKSGMIGPDDVDQPKNKISISTEGDAEATRVGIDIINPGKMKTKAEEEAFMNELVEIQIEADDDPNAPLFVPSGHQGVTQYIKRGTPQTIKRRFLYSLLIAKQAKLVCTFGKDQNGKEYNRLEGPSRPTHRVVVLRDSDAGRAAYVKWMTQH